MPESIQLKPESLGREQPEMRAEDQGHYHKIGRNSAEKRNLVISKITFSETLFGKGCFRAARFQTLTTRALGKEI